MSSVPPKRHNRRLSHSKVGLAGCSPHFVVMHTQERFGKSRRPLEKLDQMIAKGDVEGLFNAWVMTEAYPLTNQEMMRTRKAIVRLLKLRVANAKRAGADFEEFSEVLEDAKDKMKILRCNLFMHKFLQDGMMYAKKLREQGGTRHDAGNSETSATDHEGEGGREGGRVQQSTSGSNGRDDHDSDDSREF